MWFLLFSKNQAVFVANVKNIACFFVVVKEQDVLVIIVDSRFCCCFLKWANVFVIIVEKNKFLLLSFFCKKVYLVDFVAVSVDGQKCDDNAYGYFLFRNVH